MVHLTFTLVPNLGEVVDVVDKALTSPHGDHLATLKVFRHVEGDLTEIETRVVGHLGNKRQLLSSQQHGEWVAAIVGSQDFLNLNGVIAQEEVETVVLGTAIITVILP